MKNVEEVQLENNQKMVLNVKSSDNDSCWDVDFVLRYENGVLHVSSSTNLALVPSANNSFKLELRK